MYMALRALTADTRKRKQTLKQDLDAIHVVEQLDDKLRMKHCPAFKCKRQAQVRTFEELLRSEDVEGNN